MTGIYPPPPQIPGFKADGELLRFLQHEVARLLSRDTTRFPGAQPVSFAARHLKELTQQDYYICEKSDGMRCLMYLTRDGNEEVTYLIDRRNDYYHVPHLHFPLPESERDFHIDTLIDGELVNDREANGSTQLRYLVFDCLVLDGKPLVHRPLDKRLAYLRDMLFDPYVKLYEKYPDEKEFCPFVVKFKDMEKAYGIEMLFRDVLPALPHGNDGLIFTCRNTPYKPGTDPHILKWKPANENSVDFRLDLEIPLCQPDSDDEAAGIIEPYPDYAAMPGFRLSVGEDSSGFRFWSDMHVSPQEWEDLKALRRPLDETIVECYKDAEHRWRFMRLRDDKRDPNHISTVESVMESINDRVEDSHLIAAAKEIRDAWKMRERLALEREKEDAAAREREATARRNNGQKRKLASVDGEGANKRRITPQPD